MGKTNGHYQAFSVLAPGSIASTCDGGPRSGQEICGNSVSEPIVETEAVAFSDGRILDLVRRAGSRDEIALLAWKDGEYGVASQIDIDGQTHVPPRLGKALGSALRLPAGLGPPQGSAQLIAEITARARDFVDLCEEDIFLVSAFAVSTFFYDRLGVAPYLALCGPPGSGKSTLLRFLHCVTRRGLLAGEMTRASLYKLADRIRPTLLIDESDFDRGKASREFMRLLRAGNHRGADVYINEERFQIWGPKVICSRTPLGDAALATRSIAITMIPTFKDMRVLDEEAEQTIADDLQGKLERYRLEHYHELQAPQSIDVGKLTPRMRELARVLAAPMLGNPELVARLLTCLKARDEDARLDVYGEREWAVAAAMLVACHQGGLQMFMGNVAEEANRVLCELGETYPLSARAVGEIARKSLGAKTKKEGRGYYLVLSADRKRRIHELARSMGLTRADILNSNAVRAGYGGPPCSICNELGLLTGPDGTSLRCAELPLPKSRRGGLFESL